VGTKLPIEGNGRRRYPMSSIFLQHVDPLRARPLQKFGSKIPCRSRDTSLRKFRIPKPASLRVLIGQRYPSSQTTHVRGRYVSQQFRAACGERKASKSIFQQRGKRDEASLENRRRNTRISCVRSKAPVERSCQLQTLRF